MTQVFQQIPTLTGSLRVAQSKLYSTNSAIFYDGGSACLIDPALLPVEIMAIHNFIDSQHLRVENILITHCHWDHVFGPEYFPGVRVIAHGHFFDELSGDGTDRLMNHVQAFDREHQIRRARSFRMPTPDITFEHTMGIQVGGMHLKILYAPGHSSDQCVIYEPETGILWAADMLSDLEIPFVYHSLKAYQDTLERLSALLVHQLIPGHGTLTNSRGEIAQRLNEDKAYLAELGGLVEKAVQGGRSLEETQLECSAMRFKHPEENARPHKSNVEIAYTETAPKKK